MICSIAMVCGGCIKFIRKSDIRSVMTEKIGISAIDVKVIGEAYRGLLSMFRSYEHLLIFSLKML